MRKFVFMYTGITGLFVLSFGEVSSYLLAPDSTIARVKSPSGISFGQFTSYRFNTIIRLHITPSEV